MNKHDVRVAENIISNDLDFILLVEYVGLIKAVKLFENNNYKEILDSYLLKYVKKHGLDKISD